MIALAPWPQTLAPSSGAKTYTHCILHWYKIKTIKASLSLVGEISRLALLSLCVVCVCVCVCVLSEC